MKTGEYYKHKWNKYISKITGVKRNKIELVIINSGVKEEISIENFNLNYVPCKTIHDWRKVIDEAFPNTEICAYGDAIRVKINDSILDFSLTYDETQLTACYTDDIKEIIEADTNILRFSLEDANEIINMFAELILE